jgi:hypothetical protein
MQSQTIEVLCINPKVRKLELITEDCLNGLKKKEGKKKIA